MSDSPTPKTVEETLQEIVEKVRGQADTDLALLDVITTHIVRTDPSSSGVSDALRAIQKLAEQRATKSPDS